MTSIVESQPLRSAPSSGDEVFLEVADVSKAFAGNTVLDRASLSLRRGEVHALLGPNGCGKSTLIKILTGYHHPEPGAAAWVGGRPARFTRHGLTPESGAPLVIRTVHQDLGLVGHLSAVDNTALVTGYARDRVGRVRWREQERRTRTLLRQVSDEDVDVWKPLDDADPLHRTQVALARALAGWDSDEGLLILDEPTATLPEDQVEHLFRVIRSICARGITVLYVSHRLREIFGVADRVTALREGVVVGTRDVADLDREKLVEFMMGPAKAVATAPHPTIAPSAKGEVALAVSGLRSSRVRRLDFELRRGEVLGFAGLVGSGLHELPYLLVGATQADDGTITVGSTAIPARRMTPLRATRLGVGLVPADRRREALVGGRPVAENIGLPQVGAFQRRGWLRRRRELDLGRGWIDKLGIVPADPERDVDVLSGGNQQKVVLGKWLGVATAALVVSEPTAGVDIRAKDLIYRELLEQRRLGLPLVVCSTDITDLVRTCTRVIALSDGEAVAEFEGAELTEDNILRVILHRDAGHDREAAG